MKHQEKAFPQKSESKTKSLLDLVHSDVCGPMETQTVGGKKYFLTFTDDYPRFLILHLLNTNDFLKLKEFLAVINNTLGRYPRIIRTDNGGKFTGRNVQE